MARASDLVTRLRALEAEIENWAERNGGGTRRTARLYREIWEVLTGKGAFEAVRECSRRARGLANWIERHARRTRNNALGKALLEHTEFGASRSAVCRAWGIRPSEWAYLVELANWLGEKVVPGRPLRLWPDDWLSEVEELHERVSVVVEGRALEDMLLGALEAYSVPRGRGRPYTEVYGLCFGSVKTERRRTRREGYVSEIHVLVRRVALQLRAHTSVRSFVPEPRSEAVHLEMARELFPHLELVGDFHSHPYDTLAALREHRGWSFSPQDEDYNRTWVEELSEAGHRPRAGLILAIARAGRRTLAEPPGENILRALIGQCHCFLAAYRINRDGTYSANDVALRCPALTGISG